MLTLAASELCSWLTLPGLDQELGAPALVKSASELGSAVSEDIVTEVTRQKSTLIKEAETKQV